METIQEVRSRLRNDVQTHERQRRAVNPEYLMANTLLELANKCQSVKEFVEKAQQIRVTGAGIEQVDIANEYREIVLDAID